MGPIGNMMMQHNFLGTYSQRLCEVLLNMSKSSRRYKQQVHYFAPLNYCFLYLLSIFSVSFRLSCQAEVCRAGRHVLVLGDQLHQSIGTVKCFNLAFALTL